MTLSSSRNCAFRAKLSVLLSLFASFWIALIPVQSIGQAIRIQGPRAKPNLILGDTLTVIPLPTAVAFTLAEGQVSAGSSAVVITTSWTGLSLFSSISLSGYFASATQALATTAPIAYLPSSVIYGKVPTGSPTAFTAFTGTAPLGPAGSSLLLYSQSTLLSLGGARIDSLSLQIDLTGRTQVPAGIYTGSLILQAQAF